MFSRAIIALIFAAVLLVGTGAPVIAHVGGTSGAHALEHADEHAQEWTGEPSPEPGDIPSHAAPHHHCAADVTPGVAPMLDGVSSLGQAVHPALVTILHSRALAPPTQPPAA